MTTIFKSQDLWKIVQEGYEVPTSEDETEDDEELIATRRASLRENGMKDAKALGTIQGALSDAIFPRISNEETSKAAWEVLQREYRGDKKVTKVKLQSLRRDFEYTRMKEDEPLNDYFTRLFDVMNQMKTLGEELPRERLVQKLLISLTKPYDSIVNVIEETKDTDTLDAQEVTTSLRAFEQRLGRHADAATERAFQSLSINPKEGSSTGQYTSFKQQKKPWKGKPKKWEGRPNESTRNNSAGGTKPQCTICDKDSFWRLLVQREAKMQ